MRLLVIALFAVATLGAGQRVYAAPPNGFTEKADALIAQYAAKNVGGVVLIADHGKLILRTAFGLANREWNIPVSPDTVFKIGSTTKQFTAAAILQLAEQGKLKLDDPISKYYGAAPQSWAAVTLRHLLTHSSGVPDYVGANGFIRGPARLDHTPEELVALVRGEPLEFTPGSKFDYSNTGYVLLGMVIETVSGQPYARYVDEHFFRPLGMVHTAYDQQSEIVPKRASGYWLDDGVWKNARPMTTASTFAAGGLRSTADDLLAWDQALYAGKPISRPSIAAMFTDYGHGYGFGSFVETRHGHRLWDHGGNVSGFSGAFERYPDDALTVIVLTNVEGQQSEELAKELAFAYFGWDPK